MCREDGCDRSVIARGYCSMHYNRRQRLGEFSPRYCEVRTCDMEVRQDNIYCERHRKNFMAFGDPEATSIQQVRVPTEPLLSIMRAMVEEPDDGRSTPWVAMLHRLAKDIGHNSYRYLDRELRGPRISFILADRIACALGFHPTNIWPDFHEYAEAS